MNTNFKVIGLTRLGIKPKSTAPEADALTTSPSELLVSPALRNNSPPQCCVNITTGTKVIVIRTMTRCKICLNVSASVIAPLRMKPNNRRGMVVN